jgi:hypothetical protein
MLSRRHVGFANVRLFGVQLSEHVTGSVVEAAERESSGAGVTLPREPPHPASDNKAAIKYREVRWALSHMTANRLPGSLPGCQPSMTELISTHKRAALR